MIMTKEEIQSMQRRAEESGDLWRATLCARALGESLSVEPGTDEKRVRRVEMLARAVQGVTVQEAADAVARILAREIALEQQMAENIGGRADPIQPPPDREG